MFKYKSKVGKGSSQFDSARIIIPKQVREFIDVNPGDTIEWIVNVTEKGIKVNVEKSEE